MDTTDPLYAILQSLIEILIQLIQTQFSDFAALLDILRSVGVIP